MQFVKKKICTVQCMKFEIWKIPFERITFVFKNCSPQCSPWTMLTTTTMAMTPTATDNSCMNFDFVEWAKTEPEQRWIIFIFESHFPLTQNDSKKTLWHWIRVPFRQYISENIFNSPFLLTCYTCWGWCSQKGLHYVTT